MTRLTQRRLCLETLDRREMFAADLASAATPEAATTNSVPSDEIYGPDAEVADATRFDVNGDSLVDQDDVDIIIDHINTQVVEPTSGVDQQSQKLDFNGDGFVTPIDALQVINHIRENSEHGVPEGEAPKHAPLDVDCSGEVDERDALVITNFVNSNGPTAVPDQSDERHSALARLDVNGDNFITAADALVVINEVNSRSESWNIDPEFAKSVDEFFALDEMAASSRLTLESCWQPAI